jgi:hypothetical protein
MSCNGNKLKEEHAILTGRVTEADTSLYLADVRIYEKSHAKMETTTDESGYFRLEGVAFEEHDIYFEKDGYEPYILWFEYPGSLKKPLISHHIIMDKIFEPDDMQQADDSLESQEANDTD